MVEEARQGFLGAAFALGFFRSAVAVFARMTAEGGLLWLLISSQPARWHGRERESSDVTSEATPRLIGS